MPGEITVLAFAPDDQTVFVATAEGIVAALSLEPPR